MKSQIININYGLLKIESGLTLRVRSTLFFYVNTNKKSNSYWGKFLN